MQSKNLTQLALPMVVSFTFRFLFTLVDTIYAGAIKEDDPFAVAAIGLFIPIQTIFIALWVGLSGGLTASLSQAMGRKDEGRLRSLRAAMIRIHVWLTPILLLFALGLYLAIPHMIPDPGLAESFRVYAVTLVAGFPIAGLMSVFPDSMVKAHHDTMGTMYAGLCSTFANVALNTVFVFVFGWGLFGIALSTLLSRYAGFAFAVYRLRELETLRRKETPWPTLEATSWPAPVSTILTLAIPGSLTYLLVFLEEGLVNRLLLGLEDPVAMVSSYGVYNRLLSLACMPAVATAVAVMPYVGRLLPEGRASDIRADLRRSLLQCLALSLLIALPVGLFFSDSIVGFLIKNQETSNIDCSIYLRLLPIGALCVCPYLMLRPIFEAANRPRLGIRVAMVKTFVFTIPMTLLGYFGARQLDQDPLLGMLIGMILASAMVSATTYWLGHRTLAETPAALDDQDEPSH